MGSTAAPLNRAEVGAGTADEARSRTRHAGGGRGLRWLAKAPLNLFLAAIGLLWLVPTLGLLFTSLLPADRIASDGWWTTLAKPSVMTFENYNQLFQNNDLMSALVTTIIVAVANTAILVIIAAMAGYAFAWLEFPGRDVLFVVVIGLLVVPLQVALIPIFSLYQSVGLFDTALGLILFHVAFGMPFAIFLLRNFFIGIPKDIMESARIDGASELRIFFKLILPLGLPAIASLAIFQFLWTWNDLIVALTFARDTQPITVAIFSQLRQFGSNIELIAPASFVSLAIPLVVFLSFQRYFVQGLLAGSVK
jgi:alpha-glucoside transport system permease protein